MGRRALLYPPPLAFSAQILVEAQCRWQWATVKAINQKQWITHCPKNIDLVFNSRTFSSPDLPMTEPRSTSFVSYCGFQPPFLSPTECQRAGSRTRHGLQTKMKYIHSPKNFTTLFANNVLFTNGNGFEYAIWPSERHQTHTCSELPICNIDRERERTCYKMKWHSVQGTTIPTSKENPCSPRP